MITRGRGHIDKCTNFWWLELGGQADSIHDTDRLRMVVTYPQLKRISLSLHWKVNSAASEPTLKIY